MGFFYQLCKYHADKKISGIWDIVSQDDCIECNKKEKRF